MKSLAEIRKNVLKNDEVRAEYNALHDEFELINTLLEMRKKAGLTQDELAKRMGTQESNVSRWESGKGNPTFKTMSKYAKACGCELTFGFRISH